MSQPPYPVLKVALRIFSALLAIGALFMIFGVVLAYSAMMMLRGRQNEDQRSFPTA